MANKFYFNINLYSKYEELVALVESEIHFMIHVLGFKIHGLCGRMNKQLIIKFSRYKYMINFKR